MSAFPPFCLPGIVLFHPQGDALGIGRNNVLPGNRMGTITRLLAFVAVALFCVACGAKKLWGVDVDSKEDVSFPSLKNIKAMRVEALSILHASQYTSLLRFLVRILKEEVIMTS